MSFLFLAVACGKQNTIPVASQSIEQKESLNAAPNLPSFLTQIGKMTVIEENYNSRYDQCLSVAIDSEKNVYCAGVTDGAVGEPNGGSADAFIMKTAPNGTVLWITQLGKTTLPQGQSKNYDTCLSLAIDKDDHIYCAGYTEGSLGEANAGGSDIFITKLTSAGNIVWITQLGKTTKGFSGGDNSKNDICYGVAVDGEGSIYCAGSTQGSIGEKNAGRTDAFVLKLSSEGKVLWAKQFGEKTKGFAGANNKLSDECRSIAIDSSNNIYCGGYTYGSIAESNAGEADALIIKLSSTGAVYWVRQLGLKTKAFASANHTKIDICTSIAIDVEKNVYCAGYTYGSIGATNAGLSDGFAVKFDFAGTLKWAVQLTNNIYGTSNSGEERLTGISVNANGEIYATGDTSGDLGDMNAGFWNQDIFIAKIVDAKVSWVKQLGKDSTLPLSSLVADTDDKRQSDFCHALAVTEDFVTCVGSTFGALGEQNAGESDAFIWKMAL